MFGVNGGIIGIDVEFLSAPLLEEKQNPGSFTLPFNIPYPFREVLYL
jgi:hypothetical protein